MNLSEKVHLFHGSGSGYVGNVEGNSRLGIPAIRMNDGPQGFRDNVHPGSSTAWPCSLAIGATFDRAAASVWGAAMGDEFFRKGSNLQLGPGMCIARVPRNGRNFEYISGEDPYLGYVLVQPVVTGIQAQGVVANAKHWVNNNQETDRGSVDEVVDEKTQFQMYYPPFEGAIEAGVGSVMCSYNKIRGVWSCENADTLQRDLKERLGFNGWVMSDWGATHSNSSVMAGLDQEMPGSDYLSSDALLSAVKTGALPASRIDDAAMRILTPFFTVGAFDRPNLNTQDSNVSSPEHSALARSLAASSIVLLKNSGGALPLSPSGGLRLVLFGKSAIAPVVTGGGSGNVIPSFLPSPYDAIAAKLGVGAPVQGGAPAADPFASPSSQLYPASLPPVCDVSGRSCLFYAEGADASALTALAASAEVAIVFVSTSSCEGSDRASLGFDLFGDALVEAVAAAGFGRVVVAAVAPGAVLTPWREAVDAITLAFMPGQEYANALADVLFGQVNPSAKLPLTLPAREDDLQLTARMWPGVFPRNDSQRVAIYSERLLVGYRFYDAKAITPAFPFGHGLSYTNFSLSNLSAASDLVSVTVANTGPWAGRAVPQLYLAFPAGSGEPPQQLRGFGKTASLAPGQAERVEFKLRPRDVSVWDATAHAWAQVPGEFGVSVGFSSRCPRALKASFRVGSPGGFQHRGIPPRLDGDTSVGPAVLMAAVA